MLSFPSVETRGILVLARKLLFPGLLLFSYCICAQKPKEIPENSAYDIAIRNADNLLMAGSYLRSINEYERAWVLYPRQKYPEKKIDQIYKTIANLQLTPRLFGEAVKAGDSCYNAGDYKNANIAYFTAVSLNPDDAYVKERLTLISKQFDDPENETRYRIVLIHAGKSLEKSHFARAVDFYRQALLMKPDETWLVRKIDEVNALSDKKASAMDAYTRLLDEADHLLEQKKLAEAREEYVKATSLKPKENYPAAKIFLIDHLLAFEYTGQQTYASLIKDADMFYKLEDFENAGIHYQQALNLQPGEQHPKNMLRKITHNNIHGDTYLTSYESPVINADILAMAGDNEAAVIGYRRCLDLFPDDPYLLSRIRELSKVSGDGNGPRDAYQLAIENGEKSIASLNYSKALTEFRYASRLKPEESYPKAKMEALQQLIAQEIAGKQNASAETAHIGKEAAKESPPVLPVENQAVPANPPADPLQGEAVALSDKKSGNMVPALDNYQVLIDSADHAFAEKNYTLAISGYDAALEYRPEENYPRTKAAECRLLVEELKRAQDGYTQLITSADNSFNTRDYLVAVKAYNAALEIRKEEIYPMQQISAINAIIQKKNEEIAAEASKPEEVSSVNTGIPGKSGPEKVTPPEKKTRTNSPPVKQQDSDDDNYNKAIEFADNSYNEKKYAQALNGYSAALRQRPGMKYPQERIDLIRNLQKASQDKYNQIILAGDDAFAKEDYAGAKNLFELALELMPGQKYPQARISAINAIVGKQLAAREGYNRAIAFADQSFDGGNYTEALSGYQFASGLLPGESYPKERILVINNLLGQSKDQLVSYHKAIAEADHAYLAMDYPKALSIYETALSIRPSEVYPKQKIAAINVTLGQLKARKDKYNSCIGNGDLAFEEKDYVSAITAYKAALDVYPAESYPKERIEAVNAKLKELKVIQDNYSRAVFMAEKALAAKDYSAAIAFFETASGYKPAELYPKEKILAIGSLISENMEKMNRQYAAYLEQGESFYAGQKLEEAQKAFKIASMIKPEEAFPKQRADEIGLLITQREGMIRESYNKAIAEADKAYKSLILDEAIRLYTSALEIRPGEPYPGQMIYRIRKYMMENSVVEVTSEQFLLKNNSEKSFSFKPVDVKLRSKNYLVIRARSSSKVQPKLYVNFGRDKMKNGGMVLKTINSELIYDFVVNVSMQDKWFREDNNWLSLYSENGDIEVSSIRISQGR